MNTLFLIRFLCIALAATTVPTTAPSPVVRFLEDRVARDPDDIVALNRLSGEYLARFRESGNDADLDRAFKAAEQSLQSVPADVNTGGLAARARASHALHRFAAARDDGRRLLTLVPNKRYPLEILGDALLELGDYAGAGDIYAKMETFPGAEPDAGTEVRVARLALIRGDRPGAARRFAKAVELARADERTGPVVLAWALVQSGAFEFASGRWEAAEANYLDAMKVKPDDWPALDHLAELRAAQERFDEAISAYRKLVERVPRPELFQALGDVYRGAKRPREATEWHARAKSAYSDAAGRGSAHYFHHLAGFYTDVEPDAAEAVRWARADMKVRRSAYAYDALAWALYHAGDFKGAAEAMDAALASGLADAHVLYHAAMIYVRAGRAAEGRDALWRAGEVNPKFTAFHVHR